MNKFLIAIAISLLAFSVASAQTSGDPRQSSNLSQNSSTSAAPENQQTDQSNTTSGQISGGNGGQIIQGCLTGSAGSYTLADTGGRSYTLSGDDDQLSNFSGQEVQVTGSIGPNTEGRSDASSSDNSPTSSNTAATNSSLTSSNTGTIQVESVTKVSDHCGGNSENPNSVSETPPKTAGVPLLGVLGFGFMIAGLAAARNGRASD